MTDEHTMPYVLRRPTVWNRHTLSASEFSPAEWAALGMGMLGFSVEILASVFQSSAFSMAVRSDMGTFLATINAISVAAVVINHILRKERTEIKGVEPSPQMPDSSESECEKMNRVRRRRED